MKNFRVIRKARLEFRDALIGIIGSNGAGKSSIIEAIAFALYGNQAARTGKEQIKSSYASADDNCEVALEFEVEREHYRIVRRLVGRNDKPEVMLLRASSSESVGSTETRKHIEQLLGLDLKGFQTSFLAQQQELNALSDLPPHKRREHLAGMLGIERLDKAIDRAKGDTKIAAVRVDSLERQVDRDSDLVDNQTKIGEHIGLLRVRLASELGARNSVRAMVEETSSSLREHAERKDRCSQVTAAIRAAQATAGQLQERITSLRKEVAQLASAAGEAEQLKVRIDGSTKSRERFNSLAEIEKGSRLAGELERQLKETKAAEAATAEQFNKVQRELTTIRSEAEKMPTDLVEQIEQADREIKVSRQDWTTKSADRKSFGNDLIKLEGQLESIATVGPETICDRCHRQFGDDIPAITKHLESEQQQLKKMIVTAERDLEDCRQRGAKQGERLAELQKIQVRQRELGLRQTSLNERHDELQKMRNKQAVEIGDIEKRLTQIGDVRFDPVEHEQLKQVMTELEKWERRQSELVGMLHRSDDARNELTKSETTCREQELLAAGLEKELIEIGFDQGEFDLLSARLDETGKKFEVERDKVVATEKELEVAERELAIGSERLEKLSQLTEELDTHRSSQYYGERLARLFVDFRTFTIARIRPRLSELSGVILSEMTGGRYSLVELDDQYNISILDSTGYFEIGRFSGGEKDLANLCLRLAIAEALTEAAGLDRSFLILDEVFGSQDNARRDLIFDGLVNLRTRFPQMLLVTHIEEIKHKVEHLMEVKQTSAGWSEIIVDGTVV